MLRQDIIRAVFSMQIICFFGHFKAAFIKVALRICKEGVVIGFEDKLPARQQNLFVALELTGVREPPLVMLRLRSRIAEIDIDAADGIIPVHIFGNAFNIHCGEHDVIRLAARFAIGILQIASGGAEDGIFHVDADIIDLRVGGRERRKEQPLAAAKLQLDGLAACKQPAPLAERLLRVADKIGAGVQFSGCPRLVSHSHAVAVPSMLLQTSTHFTAPETRNSSSQVSFTQELSLPPAG